MSAEERVRRGVGRTIGNVFSGLLLLALLGAWSSLGFYTIEAGQQGVVLRFGRYVRTEVREGLHFHLPRPVETVEILSVDSLLREEFGMRAGEAGGTEAEMHEAAMQTSDNNIVLLGFVVQYKIKDLFYAKYRVADPRRTLRDAAQAAIREVVGRTSIDGVLSEKRGAVEDESLEILQAIMDSYESGLVVTGLQLQEVQPPAPVRDAFDDVLAASQDRNRLINEAEGYANEVVPEARAQARELLASAAGYREARVAEATGEATRFLALAAEYQRAPEVTRRRLYLETMEEVLPEVEMVIIEPGTNLLPYLPIGEGGSRARPPEGSP
ncbi:MAG: FtsH protease activity modulator HflK [Myxococcota bacterium]